LVDVSAISKTHVSLSASLVFRFVITTSTRQIGLPDVLVERQNHRQECSRYYWCLTKDHSTCEMSAAPSYWTPHPTFATVCMYVTAGLVDVSAIPKTHVSLSGRLPLWYLDFRLSAQRLRLHCLLGRMACLPTDTTQTWSTTWDSLIPFGGRQYQKTTLASNPKRN
jgi:hypothetical protein